MKKVKITIQEAPDNRVILDIIDLSNNKEQHWLFEKGMSFDEAVKSIPEVVEKLQSA